MTTNTKSHNHDESMGHRKAQHLEICLDETRFKVETRASSFDDYQFIHRALPEIGMADISTNLEFLGHMIDMPLAISSMTGGSEEGFQLNKQLAELAQKSNVPVGMGSIRIVFRRAEVMPHFMLKSIAPDVPVVANLGAVQIRDMVHTDIIEILKRLEVDALAIHLNPGQELIQPEGDRDFQGIIDAIRNFCARSPIPVIVKETGAGIGAQEAVKLVQAGAQFVNIAGSGGTNWMQVETYREEHNLKSLETQDIGSWGNDTAMVLHAMRLMEEQNKLPYTNVGAMTNAKPKKNDMGQTYRGLLGSKVIASGGIRKARDIAVCLALGAYMTATALPIIRAVKERGLEGGLELMNYYKRGLKQIMLLTGSKTLDKLRAQPLLVKPESQSMVDQYMRAMSRV